MQTQIHAIRASLLEVGAPDGDALDDFVCEAMTLTRAFDAQNIRVERHGEWIDICFELQRELNASERAMVELSTQVLQKHNVSTSIGEFEESGVYFGHIRWNLMQGLRFPDLPQEQQNILSALNLRVTWADNKSGPLDTRVYLGREIVALTFYELSLEGEHRTGFGINMSKLPYTGGVQRVMTVETIEQVYEVLPALLLQWLVLYGAQLIPSLVGVSLHALREYIKAVQPLLRK